jgi:N-methylhydantoinase B
MATHVSLTATTPILNQSNERNATILDGRGALAAQGRLKGLGKLSGVS